MLAGTQHLPPPPPTTNTACPCHAPPCQAVRRPARGRARRQAAPPLALALQARPACPVFGSPAWQCTLAGLGQACLCPLGLAGTARLPDPHQRPTHFRTSTNRTLHPCAPLAGRAAARRAAHAPAARPPAAAPAAGARAAPPTRAAPRRAAPRHRMACRPPPVAPRHQPASPRPAAPHRRWAAGAPRRPGPAWGRRRARRAPSRPRLPRPSRRSCCACGARRRSWASACAACKVGFQPWRPKCCALGPHAAVWLPGRRAGVSSAPCAPSFSVPPRPLPAAPPLVQVSWSGATASWRRRGRRRTSCTRGWSGTRPGWQVGLGAGRARAGRGGGDGVPRGGLVKRHWSVGSTPVPAHAPPALPAPHDPGCHRPLPPAALLDGASRVASGRRAFEAAEADMKQREEALAQLQRSIAAEAEAEG